MKAKDLYDIAIIGTGPASATLARLLYPKYNIIAIDKKTPHGDGFQKPCGGLICTDAQKALASFDLTLPKDVLVDPQIFAVKTIDLKNKLIRHYQRFYINMDRHKFDLWLESLLPKTVELHSNAVCTELKRLSHFLSGFGNKANPHRSSEISRRGGRRKFHRQKNVLSRKEAAPVSFHTAVVPRNTPEPVLFLHF